MTDSTRSYVRDEHSISQQPDWDTHPDRVHAVSELSTHKPLVRIEDFDELYRQLEQVANGGAHVLQIGDCAENLAEDSAAHHLRKTDFLALMSRKLGGSAAVPVVGIGRIGGQFAKPRTNPTEMIGNVELPSFKGELINSPDATVSGRAHDPLRMVSVRNASRHAIDHLAEVRRGTGHDTMGPWSSHEALVLDYERPQIRENNKGIRYLTSTHVPWIGNRTRSLDSAHVALMASVANPVGIKIGPETTAESIVALCHSIDPDRISGRLTLIARLGNGTVESVLPALVRAVQNAGHNPIWLCDPLHGNTLSASNGVKTRRLADAISEVQQFCTSFDASGARPSGLHLETASHHVTECTGAGVVESDLLSSTYETLCDPRLNPEQTEQVISAFTR
ncbi:3-deoxy-7-phosphoheptulonate synthase [Rhodococcus sp. 27YEA15]|uniref:3-deoxy-7-phosphoheptulonate synthase n=1 Tax=Rhodococcus sp. 27YEA15 TaxID=3156259 RepID=UPI003C7CF880